MITNGLFRSVRNPIFTAMTAVIFGVVLTKPSVIACVAVLAVLLGVELQVRYVEEPYLIRVHGERYRAYAHRVGRFAPGLDSI